MELLHLFANQAAVAIQNAQLYEMATFDPLTRVYVRRFFEQCLIRELRSAFRLLQPLILLMLDVDSLKSINDLAGHLVGDQALATFGQVLHQATRGSDIVGRYGGDEFTILLPQTDLSGAILVAERFLSLLHAKSVAGPQGPLQLQSSIGLSQLEPQSFNPDEIPRPIPMAYFQSVAQRLLKASDEATYESKRLGGNQIHQGSVVVWPPL
jgi:two-component system cell cycle response regulator